MKFRLWMGCLIWVNMALHAQTAPSSDIFIAKLAEHDGQLQIGQLKNITQRPGYDNQPYFLANEDALLYTAQIGEQTDIMLYKFDNDSSINITNSQVSEYSPTPLANNREFSVIYAQDGKQQLWAYQLDGAAKRPLITDDFKIGYHAWVDRQHVLMTVLQEGPMNLQLANLKTKHTKVLHPMTGASVFAIPQSQYFSFNTGIDKQHWLMQIDLQTGQKKPLVALPNDANYYTWTPDGKALVASQNKLWFWDSKKPQSKLKPFADIQAVCPGGASRMAVNAQQTRLAIVCYGDKL